MVRNKMNRMKHKEPPYIECVATGWGMSYEDGEKLSDKLIQTRVLIFDNER